MNDILMTTDLPLPLFCRGKVRDTYNLGSRLLIVATDRISAFDFVLPCGIPGKGCVLNQLSSFWFKRTAAIVPNHLIKTMSGTRDLEPYLDRHNDYNYLFGRAMVVRKVKRVPVECVVRGYIAGSAWDEYRQQGTICGIPQPKGLRQSQELSDVLFTPTTKADSGHDEPLSPAQLVRLVGAGMAQELEKKSVAIYHYAREYARIRGIIIADTKMEFGLDGDNLMLIDELLTPDSSRFWDSAQYVVGQSQPSYDKQPVRDWLIDSGWNREPPVPTLPPEVIAATADRYRKAFEVLTGRKLRASTRITSV